MLATQASNLRQTPPMSTNMDVTPSHRSELLPAVTRLPPGSMELMGSIGKPSLLAAAEETIDVLAPRSTMRDTGSPFGETVSRVRGL
jgi:hypothetical protein